MVNDPLVVPLPLNQKLSKNQSSDGEAEAEANMSRDDKGARKKGKLYMMKGALYVDMGGSVMRLNQRV